jgi:hypothetical protein
VRRRRLRRVAVGGRRRRWVLFLRAEGVRQVVSVGDGEIGVVFAEGDADGRREATPTDLNGSSRGTPEESEAMWSNLTPAADRRHRYFSGFCLAAVWSSPCRPIAHATMPARRANPSLVLMWSTWDSTLRGEMMSRSAISVGQTGGHEVSDPELSRAERQISGLVIGLAECLVDELVECQSCTFRAELARLRGTQVRAGAFQVGQHPRLQLLVELEPVPSSGGLGRPGESHCGVVAALCAGEGGGGRPQPVRPGRSHVRRTGSATDIPWWQRWDSHRDAPEPVPARD